MTFLNKEEWLQSTIEDKHQAVLSALNVLSSIDNKTHEYYGDHYNQGKIPALKKEIRTFIRNTLLWETELSAITILHENSRTLHDT